jgi:hypothetical protein
MTTDTRPKAGLEDAVAAASAICYLDGDAGVLAYCGSGTGGSPRARSWAISSRSSFPRGRCPKA